MDDRLRRFAGLSARWANDRAGRDSQPEQYRSQERRETFVRFHMTPFARRDQPGREDSFPAVYPARRPANQ